MNANNNTMLILFKDVQASILSSLYYNGSSRIVSFDSEVVLQQQQVILRNTKQNKNPGLTN